jgi:hypothetical protein
MHSHSRTILANLCPKRTRALKVVQQKKRGYETSCYMPATFVDVKLACGCICNVTHPPPRTYSLDPSICDRGSFSPCRCLCPCHCLRLRSSPRACRCLQTENLDEELQREIVHRCMRQQVRIHALPSSSSEQLHAAVRVTSQGHNAARLLRL